jgi:hypothetical protein
MPTLAIFHLYRPLTTNTINIYKNQLIVCLRQTFLLATRKRLLGLQTSRNKHFKVHITGNLWLLGNDSLVSKQVEINISRCISLETFGYSETTPWSRHFQQYFNYIKVTSFKCIDLFNN